MLSFNNDVVSISTDKELLSVKERQDMEIEAHRSTIQEQRAQIEILRNVQANQLRLDEEVGKQVDIIVIITTFMSVPL